MVREIVERIEDSIPLLMLEKDNKAPTDNSPVSI